MRAPHALLLAAIGVAAGGCGGVPIRVAALDDVERVRVAAGQTQDEALAPEVYARAAEERRYAFEAHAASDDVGATLHAERAIAAYGRARAVARYARASSELDSAQKSLDDATVQEAALEASRARLQHEADDLEGQVHLAHDRLLPAPSAAAGPEREAARAIAARALGTQARLLCSAARLVAADAHGLADAESEASASAGAPHRAEHGGGRAPDATGKTPDDRQSPVDAAARARTRCLEVLTTARRTAGYDAGATDALLAELSAAGGWDPSADERGVVVTLRNVFRGADLTDPGSAKLAELGRVATAHPLFGVQIVVHDAGPPPPGDTTDTKRANAATQALVRGCSVASRVHAELAGAYAPVVDPGDAAARARNDRLEIVFVGR